MHDSSPHHHIIPSLPHSHIPLARRGTHALHTGQPTCHHHPVVSFPVGPGPFPVWRRPFPCRPFWEAGVPISFSSVTSQTGTVEDPIPEEGLHAHLLSLSIITCLCLPLLHTWLILPPCQLPLPLSNFPTPHYSAGSCITYTFHPLFGNSTEVTFPDPAVFQVTVTGPREGGTLFISYPYPNSITQNYPQWRTVQLIILTPMTNDSFRQISNGSGWAFGGTAGENG